MILQNAKTQKLCCICPKRIGKQQSGDQQHQCADNGGINVSRNSGDGKDVGKYKSSELFENCLAMLPQDPKCLFVKKTVQEDLEEKAFVKGGENYFAPVQLVGDFLEDKESTDCGSVTPSYLPGVKYTSLKGVLPDFVIEMLKYAIKDFDTKMKGFNFKDAVLTGVETRSSAPLRILRDETFQSNIKGLIPIGEGAGYAGGIMSASLDGINCAEKILHEN